jgi:response regulator RpfG family c-di-GMP phosphodiesterase
VRNAIQRHDLIVRNTVLQATTLAMNEQLVSLNKALETRVSAEADHRQRLSEMNQVLQLNLHHSVQLCLKVLQSFYPTLGTQARRVFGLCRAMADILKLSETDRQTLELAAWLHDIGLVGTPRGLIRKWLQQPETITPAERSLIEQHPILGEELVDFAANLKHVGRVIRGHHEQFDGRGYPDRLAGKEIPWLSRVLAVAVAYAEKKAPHAAAVETLTLGSGWRFDPEAVYVHAWQRGDALVFDNDRMLHSTVPLALYRPTDRRLMWQVICRCEESRVEDRFRFGQVRRREN